MSGVSPDDARLLRELEREEEREDARQQQEWKNKHCENAVKINNGEVVDRQLLCLLNIVTVKNLATGTPTCVAYELHSQEGWLLSDNGGVGRTCLSYPVHNTRVGQSIAAYDYENQFLLRQPVLDDSMRPSLLFSIISSDSWSRERVEGYAELKLPPAAGYYDTTIELWKPVKTTMDAMEDYFLGSEHMSMNGQIAPSATCSQVNDNGMKSAVLSRFGTASISTGATLRIRLQIVELRPELVPHSTSGSMHPTVSAVDKGGIVKRSVEEIILSSKRENRSTGEQVSAMSVANGLVSRLNNRNKPPSSAAG